MRCEDRTANTIKTMKPNSQRVILEQIESESVRNLTVPIRTYKFSDNSFGTCIKVVFGQSSMARQNKLFCFTWQLTYGCVRVSQKRTNFSIVSRDHPKAEGEVVWLKPKNITKNRPFEHNKTPKDEKQNVRVTCPREKSTRGTFGCHAANLSDYKFRYRKLFKRIRLDGTIPTCVHVLKTHNRLPKNR